MAIPAAVGSTSTRVLLLYLMPTTPAVAQPVCACMWRCQAGGLQRCISCLRNALASPSHRLQANCCVTQAVCAERPGVVLCVACGPLQFGVCGMHWCHTRLLPGAMWGKHMRTPCNPLRQEQARGRVWVVLCCVVRACSPPSCWRGGDCTRQEGLLGSEPASFSRTWVPTLWNAMQVDTDA